MEDHELSEPSEHDWLLARLMHSGHLWQFLVTAWLRDPTIDVGAHLRQLRDAGVIDPVDGLASHARIESLAEQLVDALKLEDTGFTQEEIIKLLRVHHPD